MFFYPESTDADLARCASVARLLSVSSFGADPSGARSSTNAFRAAVGAAKAMGGGMVVVPQGDYICGTVLIDSHNIAIVGFGSGVSRIRSEDGGSIFTIGGSSSHLTWRGLSLLGNNTGSGSGIESLADNNFSYNITIDDVVFNNHGSHGLHLRLGGGTFNISVSNCSASNNGGDAFRVCDGPRTVFTNCLVQFVADGFAGYRLFAGGTLIGCNGITSGNGSVWGRFGARATAEDSLGITTYPTVTLVQCNLEYCTADTIEVMNALRSLVFIGCQFQTRAGASYNAQSLVTLNTGTADGGSVDFKGCTIIPGAGSAWRNGCMVNCITGGVTVATNRSEPALVWQNGISHRTDSAIPAGAVGGSSYRQNRVGHGGCHDFEHIGRFSLGNSFQGADMLCFGAPAMPTTGDFPSRCLVFNTANPAVENGKMLLGWRRLRAGSGHVLGTDWAAQYCTTS